MYCFFHTEECLVSRGPRAQSQHWFYLIIRHISKPNLHHRRQQLGSLQHSCLPDPASAASSQSRSRRRSASTVCAYHDHRTHPQPLPLGPPSLEGENQTRQKMLDNGMAKSWLSFSSAVFQPSGPVVDLSLHECSTRRKIPVRSLIHPINVELQRPPRNVCVHFCCKFLRVAAVFSSNVWPGYLLPFSIRAQPVSTSYGAAGSTTTASTLHSSTCSTPSSWEWSSSGRSASRFPSCCSSGRLAVTWVVALKPLQFTLRFWGELCCCRMFERPTPSMHRLRRTHHWRSTTARFTLPSSYITG